MMKTTTFIAWGEGDRTVGDGTFNAEVHVDIEEDLISDFKETLRTTLSPVWDLAPRYIHVMTEEEYMHYTVEEAEIEM